MEDDEKTEDKKPQSQAQHPWSELMIFAILTQVFWWFMFAKPFLALLGQMVKAIDKIAGMQ